LPPTVCWLATCEPRGGSGPKNRHVDLKSIEVPEKTARLQDALLHLVPGNDIKVVAHVQPRQTTAEMATGLNKILAEEKAALILWQAGTADLAPCGCK
jgi:hypothetical protein